jgi:thiamine-phosphate pyrophosphorylase
MVQIREKSLPARMLLELAASAVETVANTSTLILINDRADIAIASGADGVHLPGNSIPADVLRRAFGRELVIGVSTHSMEEAEAAAASGADYIFYGPVYDTPVKGACVGLEALKAVVSRVKAFPVIALGGIDKDNFRDAMTAGAAGVAAIRSLNEKESRDTICSALV